MRYAEVCVNTPLGLHNQGPAQETSRLGQTFTYAIPERLADRLLPGHLVWVPFRGRRLQAVVIRLSDAAPQFAVREIDALVWAQPLLTPTQLALAHWISDYYLAPLIEALRLMLPAGLTQRGRTVFARTAVPAPAGLTPSQTALLLRIEAGAGEWRRITEKLPKVTQKDDLEPLIGLGLVTREMAFRQQPPRPKTDRQVRLLADARTIERRLPTLGRSSRQADLLAWLAAQAYASAAGGAPPGPTPVPVGSLLRAVGCTMAPVRALAQRGWIVLSEPGAAGGPPMVTLAIAENEVPDALVALRGSARHKAVLEALLAHDGPAWIGWVYARTDATLDTLRDLEAAGLVTVVEEMVWRDPLAGHEFGLDQPPLLTDDQEQVWSVVRSVVSGAADPPGGKPAQAILLHGVTGSGKTEIYLRALAEALALERQAIVLVPEIALTPQTIRRFAARFPGRVTVWHSELGAGERFDVWRRVHSGHPAAQVVVGSRSALFLPYPRLGVIIVDEEHEPSYKQERTPRYHARQVALELGRLAGVPVILGSATPALETYHAARRGEILHLALPRRVLGWQGEARPLVQPDAAPALPPVRVVDMRQELRAGNRSMFSRALSASLGHTLSAGQQAILYLNRRGTATFVLCRDCGHVEVCPRCGTPLTLHGVNEKTAAAGAGGGQLLCHHCNRRYPVPAVCPSCGSRRIRFFGAGTERVAEAVALEFPGARTLRWDRDVTGAKGSHDEILSRFIAHEADVLIGTQMIAKGLDLPLVTLVGVVAADSGLYLPDFRAAERTFQLLTQVAGRAGRSALGGEVIIQTYHPEHYAIVAASRHDYEGFYRQEMIFRREQGYPPVRRLALLTYHHGQRTRAQSEATRLAAVLQAEIERAGLPDTDLIGPAPCFFARMRGEYRWHVIVRSPDPTCILRRCELPSGWRVDIDPVDLL